MPHEPQSAAILGATPMAEISLVCEPRNFAFAERLAEQFESLGHTVFTGPTRFSRREQYRNLSYYTKLSNLLNVLVMDLRLYQQHREYVHQFCAALSTEQKNIRVISLDNDWPTIQDELLV